MSTITTIKHLIINGELSNGRYLVDKLNESADLHHVIRTLRDGESAFDAWNSQRSDDACVVHIDGDNASIII